MDSGECVWDWDPPPHSLTLAPSWPHRRTPSPDSSSAPHVWKWKSIMPFTRLPALRATAIYISPTLPRHLHVINLPPAERGRAGWQTTRKAIFISGLQPPNCRLAFIQFSPALSLSSRRTWIWLWKGNEEARVVWDFKRQVRVMKGFTLSIARRKLFNWWVG